MEQHSLKTGHGKRPRTTGASTSKRFRLTLEYDGTNYSGWQKQLDASTIQGSLLAAAAEIFAGQAVDIQGNGRTDAGVHALRYTAHLAVATELEPPAIHLRFNDLLPKDIVVLAVERAHPDFHARHSCLGRSYLYRISRRKTAFGKRYVWWVKDRLDLAAMREVAPLFEGMHDFVSFAERQELKKSTKVLVHRVALWEDGETIVCQVVGSHFLWKMVRRLVGILAAAGRKQLTADDIHRFLEERSDQPAGFTASPSGLFFERAFYAEAELADFLRTDPAAGSGRFFL